jgi:hypothetical protein
LATALIVKIDDSKLIGRKIEEPIRGLMSNVANDADQALRFDRRKPACQIIHDPDAHFLPLYLDPITNLSDIHRIAALLRLSLPLSMDFAPI